MCDTHGLLLTENIKSVIKGHNYLILLLSIEILFHAGWL